MRSEGRLIITPGFWLLLLAASLSVPPHVTAAVLLAAAMHEGGHLLALRRFRVGVESIRLTAFGAELCAKGVLRLSYGRELAVTLAGPAVNLLFAPLLAAASVRLEWAWGVLFAGAHAVLGIFNLLPVPPLDGGRAIYLIGAYFFGPAAGDAAAAITGTAAALALSAAAVYLVAARGAGALFLLAALSLLHGAAAQLRRTFPPRRMTGRPHAA